MNMDNVRAFWARIVWMIRKELLSTLKDPTTRAILIVPVIVQCFLFGYAATFNLERVPYVVLDQSRSSASAEFLAKLDGGVFERVQNLSSTTEIADSIDSGAAIMAISIAPDFAENLSRGGAGTVQAIVDGRNTTTATIASGYLSRIVTNFNAEYLQNADAIRLETISYFNPNLITRWGFLPGLMGLLSLIQVMLLSGLSVAREREQGTFDQLLVTPMAPSQILIGKALVPMLIGVFQATKVLLICRWWFEIPMAGGLAALYAVLFVFTLSCTGMGLCISAISKSMQQVMVYCFVLLLPMVLLSGLATPVSNMPEVLQILTYADPLRFALDALRRIYLEGVGVSDIAMNFVPMLAVAGITLPLAAHLFRSEIG